MHQVTIYTTDYCGYCAAAKQLLHTLQMPFSEVDVTHDPIKRAWLVEKTGMRTVPQIFIDDEPIGGYTELREWAKNAE